MSKSTMKHHLDMFDELLKNDTTFEDIQGTALEKAKRLSVNRKFQIEIRKWRKKWGIKPDSFDVHIHPLEKHLFPPSYKPPIPSLKYIWEHKITRFTPEQREELKQELSVIGAKFGLDFNGNERGLLTVAAFYNLTPETIIERWDQISITITEYMTTAVKIYVNPYIHTSLREKYDAVINHLLDQLEDHEIPFDLPEAAEDFVSEIRGRKHSLEINWEKDPDPEILLKIDRNSSRSDVSRIWDHVMFQQARLWPGTIAKTRKWRTFERDYFIWKKVKKEGLTYDKAYDAWLLEHPDDPVEITAIVKGAQMINQVYG